VVGNGVKDSSVPKGRSNPQPFARLRPREQKQPIDRPWRDGSLLEKNATHHFVVLDGLKWTSGPVVLGNGIASLNLTPDFRYLGPEDTKKVLVYIWGNPPARANALGMIFPANMSPVTPESWGVVINYREEGYLKDDDAAKINYDKLLKQNNPPTDK
jgi:uncharacterized membrane-anchored protein